MDGRSMDLQQHYIEVLAKHLPEVVHEGKVDMEQLALILGEKQETADAEDRYRFTWAGKREAIRASQRPSMGTLLPDREGSSNWDTTQNLYIEGDNLEVLKLLQKSYFEQVKMIYIDPPYNTGKDFVYPDNFKSPLANYFEVTGQVDGEGNRLTSNAETSGRYHTDWLNMIYPRLRLARNLLREDGVIFISIDDNEVHNLRKVCDEIFGEDNFVGQWNWFRTATPPNLSYKIKKNIEYVLAYEKNKDTIKYKGLIKESPSNDPFTKPQNSFKTLTFPAKSICTSLADGVYPAGTYGTEKFPNKLLNDLTVSDGWNMNPVSFSNRFIWLQSTLDEQLASGLLVELSKRLVLSYKKSAYDPECPPNLIDTTVNVSSTEEAGKALNNLMEAEVFEYPKPTSLIEYLLSFKSSNDDIVLDFFSGSATTAHAVMQLNAEDGGKRRFIMVQLPEPTPEGSEARKAGYETISQIGMERIRRAGAKLREEYPLPAGELDTGFRLFRLDSSNIRAWMTDEERTELQQMLSTEEQKPKAIEAVQKRLFDSVENIVEGRTEEDLLYELALKMGLDLSSKVERRGGNSGKDIFVVGEGALMICLGEHITWEIVDDLIALHKEYNPAVCHFIFRDNGFVDDKAKTNTLESLKSAGFPAQSFTTV